MTITKKMILAVLMVFHLFTLKDAAARPFGGGDPFGFELSRGSEKQMADELKKWGYQIFGFVIGIVNYQGNMVNLKMSIVIPPEIEKRKGDLSWEGNIGPGEERRLNLTLKSKVAIEKWSSDISAHVEFLHEGFKYKRDITWGPSGFKDSGFVEVK